MIRNNNRKTIMKHYRVNEIKTEIDAPQSVLLNRAAKKLGIRPQDVARWEIRRKSIDSRHKPDLRLVYTIDLWSERSVRTGSAQLIDDSKSSGCVPTPSTAALAGCPVVVGFGPCGLFAALELAKNGYRPIVLERGPAMEGRIDAVNRFNEQRILDPEANMLFGEGGAGTFSDGKLGTGIKDGHIRDVLRTFADAGAGEEITCLAKPHIGTDVLRTVIVKLREQIIELGGEVRFSTRVDSFLTEDGCVTGVRVTDPDGTSEIRTNALILAIGHSARDTFAELVKEGFGMEQKPFSIGVRMEHPQALIDRAQYGVQAIEKYGDLLPPADYKLSTMASNGRGVYSFCMCPGGEVVTCTTAEGELCVNGMSNRKRDSGTANSGILCTVNTEDYNNGDETDILAGVRYQEKYERLAFVNGGGNFEPPKASMGDFLAGKAPQIDNSLPEFAASALKDAVPDFGRKIKGYDDPNAIVTAVETRSSSPVRILRGESGESSIRGIYPAGEGAGYAGGITSAACDGIRAAHKLIEKYGKPTDTVVE